MRWESDLKICHEAHFGGSRFTFGRGPCVVHRGRPSLWRSRIGFVRARPAAPQIDCAIARPDPAFWDCEGEGAHRGESGRCRRRNILANLRKFRSGGNQCRDRAGDRQKSRRPNSRRSCVLRGRSSNPPRALWRRPKPTSLHERPRSTLRSPTSSADRSSSSPVSLPSSYLRNDNATTSRRKQRSRPWPPGGIKRKAAIKAAEAKVEQIESMIHDLTLVSPRNGQVQYQLARKGETVAAGEPIVTYSISPTCT